MLPAVTGGVKPVFVNCGMAAKEADSDPANVGPNRSLDGKRTQGQRTGHSADNVGNPMPSAPATD